MEAFACVMPAVSAGGNFLRRAMTAAEGMVEGAAAFAKDFRRPGEVQFS